MTYISKDETLFFFLKLLLICLVTCRVAKGKAPDGKLYVYLDRKGCVSVQSQEPCPVFWQLNTFRAKVYKQTNMIVAATINAYNVFGLNDDCLQALKNSLCSQVGPKCSTVDDTSDFANTTALCEDVYGFCPGMLVDLLKEMDFCQTFITGKQPNVAACVAPSEPITGVCPQPKFKVSLKMITM